MRSFGGLDPFNYAPANFARLAVLNARVVLICGASEHCLSPPPWHASANFARLAVLNASFASLAFVKYRGAQIALWRGDRQCSLVLEYKRRGGCAVISSTILLDYQYTDIIRMWSIGESLFW